jgi:hypothetical protein
MTQGNVLSHLGSKYTLPLGTTRQNYEVNNHTIRCISIDYFVPGFRGGYHPASEGCPSPSKRKTYTNLGTGFFSPGIIPCEYARSEFSLRLIVSTGLFFLKPNTINRVSYGIWFEREYAHLRSAFPSVAVGRLADHFCALAPTGAVSL